MSGDRFAHLDGAYVLGALDPHERAEFEAHLVSCAACRARVEEIRPTVALLAVARADGYVDEVEPVPDTLLPGLLRQAGRERARRRWFTASIAAVAAACLVSLVVVLWPPTKGAGPVTRELQAVRVSPVHATASLVSRSWGTEIDLHCRYDTGVAPNLPYKLRVIDTSSEGYDAGSWTLVPGRVTDFTGGAAVPRDRIKYVQITLEDGTPILQLTV